MSLNYLIVAKVFVCDNECEHDENGNGVLVVQAVGKVVIAGAAAEKAKKWYPSGKSQYIHILFLFDDDDGEIEREY